MATDIKRVSDSSRIQDDSQMDPAKTISQSKPDTTGGSVDGRDSRIGEHAFSAGTLKAQLLGADRAPGSMTVGSALRDPAGPPATPPLTFTAEGSVPEHVFPPAGRIGPEATPQQAADFIRGLEFSIGGDTRTTQAQFFVQSLRDHAGQSQWTQQFFRALGSQKTADLIEQSVTPGMYQYSRQRDIEQSVATVRNAISDLAGNPALFSQADMNLLVRQMAKGAVNPWVASEIFGKMSYANEGIKNMFFRSAVAAAMDPKTGGRTANDLAASASHVLATTSMDNQAVQLNNLRQSGQLKGFIRKAMAGPQEYPGLWSAVRTTQWSVPIETERFARVDGLLLNASLVDVRDPFQGPQPVSSADLTALRTDLFNAAAGALTDGRIESAFKDNDMFKDAMARIFTTEFDPIMRSVLGSNRAGFDINLQRGLEKFFQDVLFTSNANSAGKQVWEFLGGRLTEYEQALMDQSPNAERNFRSRFGISRMDASAITGGLLGIMTNALNASKDELNKNAQAKADAIKFVLDLTLGLIPGIGGRLAQGVENTVAKHLIENTFGPVQNKVLDLIKSGAVEQAKKLILEQYSNANPETALLGLYNSLNGSIPNGDNPGEQNFLAQFQSSYTATRFPPDRPAR